jgi:4'-phosphopantetheinyl transferase EntD
MPAVGTGAAPSGTTGIRPISVPDLLPSCVVGVETDPRWWLEPPIDQAAVRGAFPKRRREFAAGRACAVAALGSLGHDVTHLPKLDNGSPAWPSGVVGAISHTDRVCLAAVASRRDLRGLGVDVEGGPDLDPTTARLVCSPRELRALQLLTEQSAPSWTNVVFSAKESVYKACRPDEQRRLSFLDATVELDVRAASFEAIIAPDRLGPQAVVFRGRFAVRDGVVFTAVVRPV